MHLYNANQADREGIESFLRLSGQAALRRSVTIEKEVVRDIFNAKMKFKDIQRELCLRPGNSPEETLRYALLKEAGYATASTLQKQLENNFISNYSNQKTNNPFRVKQEPTLSVKTKNLQNRINRAEKSELYIRILKSEFSKNQKKNQ